MGSVHTPHDHSPGSPPPSPEFSLGVERAARRVLAFHHCGRETEHLWGVCGCEQIAHAIRELALPDTPPALRMEPADAIALLRALVEHVADDVSDSTCDHRDACPWKDEHARLDAARAALDCLAAALGR